MVDPIVLGAGPGAALTTRATLSAAPPTDTRSGRIRLSGVGILSGDPAPVDPPDGHVRIRRISEIMPAVVKDARGNAQAGWAPTAVVDVEWGRWQLRVGGRDVTYFRGVESTPPYCEKEEPFGDKLARLHFPQIGPYDVPGTGDLAWLKPHAIVEVAVIRPNGTRKVLWEGELPSWDDVLTEKDSGLELHALGALYAGDYYRKQPPVYLADLLDLGRRLADELNALSRDYGLRLATVKRVSTGIFDRDHGAWEPLVSGWMQEALATAYLEDGRQLTVGQRRPRLPVIRWKNTTTHHHVATRGTRGITDRLAYDSSNAENAIFGEGTDPENCHWRNVRTPNKHPDTAPLFPLAAPGVFSPGDGDLGFGPFAALLRDNGFRMVSGNTYAAADEPVVRAFQRYAGITDDGIVGRQTWGAAFEPGAHSGDLTGAYFAPLSIRSSVEPFVYNARGEIIGRNPAYDRRVQRIERYENFGDRIRKSEAAASAGNERRRDQDPGIFGTITWRTDPEGGSRFEIEPGENVFYKEYRGDDVLLHIARVTLDFKTLTVETTVDEKARDAMTLASIRARQREARDPSRRQKPTYRNSKIVEDRIATWDCENGSGVIPRFAVQGGFWSVIRVPTAGAGSIVRTVLTTSSPATPFAVGILDRPITSNALLGYLGSPLAPSDTNNSPWDDFPEDRGLIMGWGGPEESVGFYPHPRYQLDGVTENAVTGRFLDDASWYFESRRPPWLWIAVYAPVSCYVEGRLYAAVPST